MDSPRRWIARALGCALCVFLRPLLAWSDQVHLANGQMLEGIVVRQSDEQVVLQVAWQGYVVLDRASLTNIEPANEAERQQLLTQWQQEHQAFQEREQHRQRFEEEQHAKGLVLYQGRWVTQEELAAVRANVQAAKEERKHRQEVEEQLAREQAERKAREEELRTLSERLRAIQEEQLRLQQEISSLRRCLRDRPRLIPILNPAGIGFVRDERGNLLRVSAHEGHFSVEIPDGTHADLHIDGDHLSFTDQRGIHHDVEQVEQAAP